MKKLLTIALLITITGILHAESLQSEVIRLRAENKQLKARIVQLTKTSPTVNVKLQQIEKKIRDMKIARSNLQRKLKRSYVFYKSTDSRKIKAKNKIKYYNKAIYKLELVVRKLKQAPR